MNCPRCKNENCSDPDSKSCSDNCITTYRATIAEQLAEIERLRASVTLEANLKGGYAIEVDRLKAELATANTRSESERLNREQQSSSFAAMRREQQAEIERLTAERDAATRSADEYAFEVGRLRAELARLREENE